MTSRYEDVWAAFHTRSYVKGPRGQVLSALGKTTVERNRIVGHNLWHSSAPNGIWPFYDYEYVGV